MSKIVVQHKSLAKFVLVVCVLLQVHVAHASKEFLTSCAYGTLAGTLVGTASLAFTEKPGENLNYIARGASLGLYAGILLGLYVVYGSSEEEPTAAQAQAPRLWVEPVWNRTKPEGLLAHLHVLTF